MPRAPMDADLFANELLDLGLSDDEAGELFGLSSAQIVQMRQGEIDIPHLLSLTMVLVAEHPDGLRIAREHAAALSEEERH